MELSSQEDKEVGVGRGGAVVMETLGVLLARNGGICQLDHRSWQLLIQKLLWRLHWGRLGRLSRSQ
jgi:hypothetical protein